MALDVQDLLSKMLGAALPILKTGVANADSYAKMEFTKIAQSIVSIGEQLAENTINSEQAKLLLDMQKNASRAVLLTLEGLGLLVAEAAINAALAVVKTAVNTALGIELI